MALPFLRMFAALIVPFYIDRSKLPEKSVRTAVESNLYS
jgi:hypothetical protein